MKVNIGGDRLGSGAKNDVILHNYNRSTHNLSKNFKSSLAPGLLYPAYVNIGLNGDKFEINMKSLIRTIPTQGPLFGSFKMQVDCFVAPIRLYQGILHNNPINIGLQMNKVKLPKFGLTAWDDWHATNYTTSQVNPSNLWKYLGLSGLGHASGYVAGGKKVQRYVNAVPLLVYYDIFKNYYANKQEELAFVVTGDNQKNITTDIQKITYLGSQYAVNDEISMAAGPEPVIIEGKNLMRNGQITFKIEDIENTNVTAYFGVNANSTSEKVILGVYKDGRYHFENQTKTYGTQVPTLKPFELKNIDLMREWLLKHSELGESLIINEFTDTNGYPRLPYDAAEHWNDAQKWSALRQPLAGLVAKTYQSDLFNNWVSSDFVDGENGIREITRIDTSNGLEMDALNLAQKVYNMLNRIAVSGGTYQDWQEAVYTHSTIRQAETPMYMGGMSSEVMFEEVIATTAAETSNNTQELGSMGGRGKQIGEKGGHIEFKIEEPSIIMILVSLTPRITYSQGNKWFLTDIESLDDLHKPALDGIGYQDLIVEQMAWWDTWC